MMLVAALVVIATAKVAIGVDSQGDLDLSMASMDKADAVNMENTDMENAESLNIDDMDSTQLKEKVSLISGELHEKNRLIAALQSALVKAHEENEAMAKKTESALELGEGREVEEYDAANQDELTCPDQAKLHALLKDQKPATLTAICSCHSALCAPPKELSNVQKQIAARNAGGGKVDLATHHSGGSGSTVEHAVKSPRSPKK